MSKLNSKGLYNCECCLDDIAEDCEVSLGEEICGEPIYWCMSCFYREQAGLTMAEAVAERNVHE